MDEKQEKRQNSIDREVRSMQLEDLKEMVQDAEKLLNLMKDIEEIGNKSKRIFIPTSIDDRLLKVKECAKRLATSEATVRSLIERGELPSLKVGELKVRESSLVKYMARQEEIDMQKEKGA